MQYDQFGGLLEDEVPVTADAPAKFDDFGGVIEHDASTDEFGGSIEPDEDYGAGDFAGDLGVSVGHGFSSLVKTLGDAYGLATGDFDNFASNYGKWGQEDWAKLKSDKLKGEEAARGAKIDAADGEWSKAGTAFWETVSNPLLLTSFLAEQAPLMLPIGAAGRGAQVGTKALGASAATAAKAGTGAAVGTGAVMQGTDAGSEAYDKLMALPEEIWDQDGEIQNADDREQAKKDKALRLSQDAAIASGIVSAGLNMLPGARMLEKQLAGVKLPGGSRIANAATGFAGETLQEAGEEGFGAYASNKAVHAVDPSQELTEGVGQAAGLGAAGGVLGGASGATNTSSEPSTQDKLSHIVTKLGEANTVDEVIASAQGMLNSETDIPAPVEAPVQETAPPELLADPSTPKSLDEIYLPMDFDVEGEKTRFNVPAAKVLTEVDSRIDTMKLLMKCVNS